MSVTATLVSFVVLLGLVAAWRLFRWRFRPGLELGPGSSLDANRIGVRVRNGGAAAAKRCRGRLLRLDRQTGGDWSRFDPDPSACPFLWTDGSTERDLGPKQEAVLVVADRESLPEGSYRMELAVIDGEERRTKVGFRVSHGASDG